MQVDETYLRILDILQRDGRMAISELARRVDRAESTVRDRVACLEQEGIIQGYRAEIDPAKIGYPVRGVLRSDADRTAVPKITDRLKARPEVVSAHLSSGPKPLTVEVVARDLHSLERLLEDELAGLPLRDTELAIRLRDLVERRPRDLSRRYEGARMVRLG